MIPISQHANAQELDLTEPQKKILGNFLMQEVTEAIAARAPLEEMWRELLRQYDGVPKKEVRETPIINAPNIEVTVGAVSSDSVYAQMIDQVFNIMPVVTVRSTNETWVQHAQDMQTFVNWIATNEANVRSAAENMFSDTVQLGSGAFYVPFVERLKKGKVYKTQQRFPMLRAIPIEDFLVPGGATELIQEARWVGMRTYMTLGQLKLYGKTRGWEWEKAKPTGPISWVRSRREQVAKTMTNADRSYMRLYEIWEIYVDYDIDGDGFDEELLVIWDRASASVLKVVYNPYDCRPFELATYQLRPHLAYGIGVLEMTRPFQEGATEIYNMWITNAMIANCRIWKAREGVVAASEDMYPNKVIPLPNPREDLIPEQMGDVYPSAAQALSTTVSFAERRVGVNDMSSQPGRMANSRTPGITALSMIQQVNRRFTPAFDAMHGALSRAVTQAIWRYRERVLMGDKQVINKIHKIMGMAAGDRVEQLLRQEDFQQNIEIELTASSSSVNREQDRQSLVLLGTQVLAPYYQRIIQLAMLAASPQVPSVIRDILIKVAKATESGIDQIVRTFDQVRDPKLLAVSIVADIEALQQQADMQAAMQQVQQALQGGTPNVQGQGSPEAAGAGPAPMGQIPGGPAGTGG